jgi:hypothetical protein
MKWNTTKILPRMRIPEGRQRKFHDSVPGDKGQYKLAKQDYFV